MRVYSILLLLLLLTAASSAQSMAEEAHSAPAEFLEVLQKEATNRATARHAISSILERDLDSSADSFWHSYMKLERHSELVYDPILARFDLRPSSIMSRLKGSSASIYYRWAPQNMLKTMANATKSYYAELEASAQYVPSDYQAFYTYVLRQEKVQVDAFAMAAENQYGAAQAVIDSFLETPPILPPI